MEYIELGKILEYEQPTQYLVETTNYRDDYDIPVLTAGQTFILGYTNETYNVFPINRLPVIIFDDFTTASKFVDFPFKVKSTAMKILNPVKGINIKYVYYAMQRIRFDNTLHKRYWISQYANIKIPLPGIEKQNKIVDEIDRITEIILYKKEQLKGLDDLIKSQFVEMFGDPILNEKQWRKVSLGTECNIITGNTPSRNKQEYYGHFIEWVKSDNINTPSNYITQAEEYLSKEGKNVGRTINEDSILMTCIAGSISCIGNVAMTNRKVAFNQQINGIETLKNNTIFMYVQFLLSKQYIQSTINMSLKGILSKGKLSELKFIFPPIELQEQFAQRFQQIDKQKFESEIELRKLQKNIFYRWGR